MSNYLNNLVLRNQQAIKVVRPRLPSIFEPPAAMPIAPAQLHQVEPLESDQHHHDADTPAAQRVPDGLIARRESEPPVQPQRPPRTLNPKTNEQTHPAWRGVQVIEPGQSLSLPQTAEAQSASDPSVWLSNVANAKEQGGRVLSVEATTNTEKRASERHQLEREARRQGPAQSLAPPPKRSGTTRSLADSAETQSDDPEAFTGRPDRRITVQPRVSPLHQRVSESGNPPADGFRSRREQGVEQAAEPQTPTINVTIGRIEIRALPPTAAPPPRKPQPSLMSLNEYMRRRNAGGDSR